mgnify:CR=1 FL=1
MGKEQLKDRLKNARKKLKVEKENPQTSNIGQAFKLSTELVAAVLVGTIIGFIFCLLYTSPSPRDRQKYRIPSSA